MTAVYNFYFKPKVQETSNTFRRSKAKFIHPLMLCAAENALHNWNKARYVQGSYLYVFCLLSANHKASHICWTFRNVNCLPFNSSYHLNAVPLRMPVHNKQSENKHCSRMDTFRTHIIWLYFASSYITCLTLLRLPSPPLFDNIPMADGKWGSLFMNTLCNSKILKKSDFM